MSEVWRHVLPKVRQGLRHGAGDATTPEAIRQHIEKGEYLLWAVEQDDGEILAAIVLEVVKHPAKMTLFVVLIAGERFFEWAPEVQRFLVEYRDLNGIDTIEASVRPGLTKWLDGLGWKKKATLMSLES